jgi:hypothetical protein
MKSINIIWIVLFIIFFGVSITAKAQNQGRIQNCITAHEFIYDRIYYEREQALAAVFTGAGATVIGSWLSMGASALATWGGVFGFTYDLYTLQDHRVSIDLIERLYWERTIQSLQDLNNCINFS